MLYSTSDVTVHAVTKVVPTEDMREAGEWYDVEALYSLICFSQIETLNPAVQLLREKHPWSQHWFYLHHFYKGFRAGAFRYEVKYNK